MRFFLPLLLLACACCPSRADAGSTGEPTGKTNMRKEVAKSFKFEKLSEITPDSVASIGSQTPDFVETQLAPKPELSPLAHVKASSPDDQAVVKMAPFVVQESIRMRDLHAAILKNQGQARASKVKFGTGVHELRLRRVSLYAVTVFYVPILMGISW